jgi:hypothetical protein
MKLRVKCGISPQGDFIVILSWTQLGYVVSISLLPPSFVDYIVLDLPFLPVVFFILTMPISFA